MGAPSVGTRKARLKMHCLCSHSSNHKLSHPSQQPAEGFFRTAPWRGEEGGGRHNFHEETNPPASRWQFRVGTGQDLQSPRDWTEFWF